ncbi:hypothetical protein CERSUDRAFT_115496 [Gelatoporia subvermispora B]|uniref:Uncharacterized protein n=1 Tax=Ceriporiopsis subvermispora (strain B) TaxID=914234 RepID=M2PJT2_CERS8|nr:hypothetical protein CERSUDRAFT_115496 [Gelatoporia subvermispora B]
MRFLRLSIKISPFPGLSHFLYLSEEAVVSCVFYVQLCSEIFCNTSDTSSHDTCPSILSVLALCVIKLYCITVAFVRTIVVYEFGLSDRHTTMQSCSARTTRVLCKHTVHPMRPSTIHCNDQRTTM